MVSADHARLAQCLMALVDHAIRFTEDGRIDITALRVVGRGRLDWTPPAARAPQTSGPVPRESRKVWIDPAHGWRDVPIYDGADLRPGCRLEGPLLIEERTTTAFVGPGDILEVDERDDFLVHVGGTA